MKNIIVPFRYGRGKTGAAMHGQDRAIICETEHYPNAFAELNAAIKDTCKEFSNQKEAENKALKYLTTEAVQNKEAHTIITEFGAYNFIFFNLPKLQSGPFRYLKSFTTDGITIHL